MRLLRLHALQEYHSVAAECKGLHVITNVSIQGGNAEAIRLNLDLPNSSYRRIGSPSKTFPRSQPPFDVLSPSLLLSAEQLREWQRNFASVYDAVGDEMLGNIGQNDPVNETILQRLQARSFEMLHIDGLLKKLAMETALYLSYQKKAKKIDLLQGNDPTPVGRTLLQDFDEAVATYSQIPELRHYLVQNDPVAGDLGPRGQQYRQWLIQGPGMPISDGCSLECVAYELRPLRLSGKHFCWNQSNEDLRLVSVDLLCRYHDQPVWCEVKMAGDTWTSSAVRQIFFYGSMLANGHQHRRLMRFFGDQFGVFRPWLGVIVEKREDPEFLRDFEQAISFAQHKATRDVLQPHFDGMVFTMIRSDGGGWAVETSTSVRW